MATQYLQELCRRCARQGTECDGQPVSSTPMRGCQGFDEKPVDLTTDLAEDVEVGSEEAPAAYTEFPEEDLAAEFEDMPAAGDVTVDVVQANRAIRALRELDVQQKDIVLQAQAEAKVIFDRADAASMKLQRRYDYLLQRYQPAFEAILDAQSAVSSVRSREFIYGTIGRRKTGGGFKGEIVDQVRAVAVMRELGQGDKVKPESVNWGDLKQQLAVKDGKPVVKGTGEDLSAVVQVEETPKTDKFYIDFPKM